MKLLKPDVGEVCDRLSIIAYKRNLLGDTKREAQELLAYIRKRQKRPAIPGGEDLVLGLLELAHINGQIWALNDFTRKRPGLVDYQHVLLLNDRRCQLVFLLTKLLGGKPTCEKAVLTP